MGFDEGSIVFDHPDGAYYAGQTVHAKLVFDQDKVKNFRGIFVKMKGYCKVHWVTRNTRRVNGERRVETVVHESHETYYDKKLYLKGAESGDHHINAGHHEFPFSCHLPESCPASYKGTYGEIQYEFHVVVDRAFKLDQEKKVTIRVIAPLDLNLDPYCREPLSFELEKSYCCSCISTGICEASVRLPAAGLIPGQVIPVEVGCQNNSNVKISNIKIAMKESVTFRAESRPGTKEEKKTIYQIKKGPIAGNTTRNWTVDVQVPTMDVINVNSCKYIDISYHVKVTLSVSGCHSDLDQSKRIVIGTIPLVNNLNEFHTPAQPPKIILTHYQTPDQTNVASNLLSNHTSPYPIGNSPYPSGNLPYPSGNSPYPDRTSPFPAENSSNPSGNLPYPSGNSPYPDRTSPYPVGNSPYPSGNPPHPSGNTPYPDRTSPYPAGTFPNPSGNLPYPTEGSQYPSGNSPHPGNLHYPNENPGRISPYPTENTPINNPNSPYPVNVPQTTGNSPYTSKIPPYPDTNSPYPTNHSNNPPYPTSLNPGTYPEPNSQHSGRTSPYPSTPNHPHPYPSHQGSIEMQKSSDGHKMPSLPIGAMPYPVTPNPYASASAPEPGTPEFELDKSDIPVNPPYNPEVYKKL